MLFQTPNLAIPSEPNPALTAENLAMMLASAMAMAFDHLPALRGWFGALEPATKRLWMSALLALLAGAVAFAGCQGWLQTDLACQPDQWPRLTQLLMLAMASNQAAHMLAKPAQDR